jgi:glycerophosphoryl diester phosphodiesterase
VKRSIRCSWVRVVVAAAVAATTAATLGTSAVAPATSAEARRPLIAAHRGGALLWPENSLTAFRNAVALGSDCLELDLHQTADGEIVVVHDATLERTTTGTGAVSALALADVAPLRLRARDGTVTDDRIPTLAQVLDLAAPTSVQLMPEIKVGADRQRYRGIEEKVVRLLRAHGMFDRATVQSFDWPTLRRLRELEPGLRTMLLVSSGFLERRGATSADAVRWATEVGATDVGLDHRLLDSTVVTAARRANVRVVAWTVNDEADIKRVIAVGADVVISDRPDLALKLIRR